MKRSKLPIIIILSIFLLLILAGCGTAGPATVTQNNESDSLSARSVSSEIESSNTAPTAIQPEQINDNPDVAVQTEAGESAEFDENGIEIGFTDSGNAYRGNPAAPVVLEEFSDFQCPYCERFTTQTLPSLIENQIAAGDVLLVYYDFPLESIHPQAFAAANAARCAGAQSAAAYWQMHDLLYSEVQQWSGRGNPNQAFITLAGKLALDIEKYTSCIEENTHQEKVQADIDLALNRGVRSTPSFFVNGEPLIGAQPVQVFDQAIAAVKNGESIAAAPEQGAPQNGELPLVPPRVAPEPAEINFDNAAGAIGDENAPVTIVEFSDYQCPFCERHFQETIPSIMSDMIETGQVRYVFKDLPLDSLHPEARSAALAARCAGEQDAYWKMHDALFESQQKWAGQGSAANDIFLSLAGDLNLDQTAFSTCIAEDRYAQVIQDNVDEAQSLGASATPYFFIDGYPIAGAQSYELFFYAVGLAEEGLLADAYDPGEPDVSQSYSIGDPNAPVTIIEYTDFQCPFCSRHFENTYGQIKENFIDKGLVHYIFKDFPLSNIHPHAQKAAEAARCAGEQNAYVEMHDKLFSTQGEWQGQSDAAAIFSTYAVDLGLESEIFDACLTSGKYEAAVLQDLEEGSKLGVNGTPAFFINGYSMSGAQPYPIFEQAINQFLEQQ